MEGTRHFTDSRGLAWTVYEVPASRIVFGDMVVDERAAHLTFEHRASGGRVCRQLRRYPADWRERPGVELEVLCNEAGPPPHGASGERALRGHLDDLST
ncbi:MAG TPA: hypothetical protein VFS05_14120 [Gemmatimonadaceae bacterium]|nr:hypothetical protein [Gemmatimonadaceae bacterium]